MIFKFKMRETIMLKEVHLYMDGKETPWGVDHEFILPGGGRARVVFYIKDSSGKTKRRLELGPTSCFDYSQTESGRLDATFLTPEQRELVCMTD